MSTVTIDGKSVAAGTGAAFGPLAEAFHAATGCTLHVRDGLRTIAGQWEAWNKYLAGGPLAAYPTKDAPHVRGVALDVFDSGKDAGVTVAGTVRSNWLRDNAPRFGFKAVGLGFKKIEPWHIELQRDPYAVATPAPAAPAPAAGDGSTPAGDPGGYNPFGIAWSRGLQKIARLYGYRGAIDAQFGAGSMAGFAQFLRANWGYVGNDQLGPVMWAAIARWLRARWGYVGNDVPGPVMRAALLRAEAANYIEL
ncbi:endolysin [Microbacterium phage Naby]|nr:endolysin [Microbacterium phage Naby]